MPQKAYNPKRDSSKNCSCHSENAIYLLTFQTGKIEYVGQTRIQDTKITKFPQLNMPKD